MHCCALDHFIKFYSTNQLDRCGHIVPRQYFESLTALEQSSWLANMKSSFARNEWPESCVRCKFQEENGKESRRQIFNSRYEKLAKIRPDYLRINFEVDTVCNAACQICNPNLSSFLARISGSPASTYNGLDHLAKEGIDPDRVVDFEIVGGDAAVSRNIRNFLEHGIDKFKNVQLVRVITNGSAPVKSIERLLQKGIQVELWVSIDGTGPVFEYCRWPIKWGKFLSVLEYHKGLLAKYDGLSIDLRSTLSTYAILDIDNVIRFSEENNLPLQCVLLDRPNILTIERNTFLNRFGKELLSRSSNEYVRSLAAKMATQDKDTSDELNEHITKQDAIRNIKFDEYYQHLNIRR